MCDTECKWIFSNIKWIQCGENPFESFFNLRREIVHRSVDEDMDIVVLNSLIPIRFSNMQLCCKMEILTAIRFDEAVCTFSCRFQANLARIKPVHSSSLSLNPPLLRIPLTTLAVLRLQCNIYKWGSMRRARFELPPIPRL